MKKNYNTLARAFRCFGFFVVVTFLTAQVNAQPINEGFNNITTLFGGGGWAQQNLSTPIGTIPTWIQGVPGNFVANAGPDSSYIAGHFNNVAGTNTISNWLFTPNRTFSNGDIITFFTRSTGGTYPDRLQVRLSLNGTSVNAGTTNASVGDFTTLLLDINPTLVAANYPSVWTQYSITITGLAAPTSGRAAFRYFVTNGGPTGLNSDFIGIDNFVYTPAGGGTADAAIASNPGQYTIVPLSQVTPIGGAAVISNVGTLTMTNATMTVNVYDGTMANVYTAASAPIASIAIGGSSPATVAGFTPTVADIYTVEQIVSITEVDVDATNDTSYYQILISPTTYARDNGNIVNLLGVGTGSTAVVGQNYQLIAPETMESVTFFIAPGSPALGDTVKVSIYNTAGGVPTTLIGQSANYIMTPADTTGAGALLTLNVSNLVAAPLALGVGTYYVGVNEFNTMNNMAIGLTSGIFTSNTAWISINGGAFATTESFSFPGAYLVRPNFFSCAQSTASISAGGCTQYTAPSGAILTSTGIYADTIPNACGSDSIITINLTIGGNSTATVNATACTSYMAPSGAVYTVSGMYIDTIPNSCAGDSIITINLTVGANTSATVNTTACTSYTAPSGATYTATGVYTDIIPNACGGDSVITINLTVPVLNLATTTVGATITSSATGSTYQWIDCGTNLPIAGATSQSYASTVDGSYAVIVTTAGCSDTSACATVLFWGLNEVIENGGLEIYPNPSNGDFTVNVTGLSANSVNIELLDFSGRVIEARSFNNVQGQLTAEMNVNVDAGSYLVRISANGESTVQTIVISK